MRRLHRQFCHLMIALSDAAGGVVDKPEGGLWAGTDPEQAAMDDIMLHFLRAPEQSDAD